MKKEKKEKIILYKGFKIIFITEKNKLPRYQIFEKSLKTNNWIMTMTSQMPYNTIETAKENIDNFLKGGYIQENPDIYTGKHKDSMNITIKNPCKKNVKTIKQFPIKIGKCILISEKKLKSGVNLEKFTVKVDKIPALYIINHNALLIGSLKNKNIPFKKTTFKIKSLAYLYKGQRYYHNFKTPFELWRNKNTYQLKRQKKIIYNNLKGFLN